MHTPPDTAPDGTAVRNGLSESELSLGQLAHELNSLLDGSLRSLRLAEGGLDRAPESPPAAGGSPGLDEVRGRLATARRGLEEIAAILGRAMSAEPAAAVLATPRSLGEEIDGILAAVTPLASRSRVALIVEAEPEARRLPAGPLGSVVGNGLRNAIDACVAGTALDRRAELSLYVDHGRAELVILIADNGPGVPGPPESGRSDKPLGHGHGLVVCSKIVAGLAGRIGLTNVPFGEGAVLQARIPLRSLLAP
jgi:signal transduction histidine kinase